MYNYVQKKGSMFKLRKGTFKPKKGRNEEWYLHKFVTVLELSLCLLPGGPLSTLQSLSLISQELASFKIPLSHSVTSKIADRKLKIDCKILEDRNFPFV